MFIRLLKRGCVTLIIMVGMSAGLNAQPAVIPTFAQVKQQSSHSDFLLHDKQGRLLQTQRIDWHRRQGEWLDLEAISPAVLRLVLQAEDRRFYTHSGVDWYAVAGSTWAALWGKPLRGTSTLSMQLVDLLDIGPKRTAGRRSWKAKWQQAQFARQLEKEWSKSQILEAYLNLAPFRGELIGINALARVVWQKHAVALSLPEAALAIAMLPSPNARPEQLLQRSCVLWRSVAPEADCRAQYGPATQALKRLAQPAWGNPNGAPHAARFIQRNGLLSSSLRSSLDQTIQHEAQRLMQRHLVDLKAHHATDAAVLVLHNITGQVLAYVGSSTESLAVDFDHVQAKRQAGSTLKPFLYQLALTQQRITPASLLADTPAQFSTPYGMYVPQNYDEQFMGWVSARVALASSLNIPAVRLLSQVGVEDFQMYLKQLGFELPYAADYYGLGLALGGVEVSLWELTNAYRSLANLGSYSVPCVQAACTASATSLMSAAATWLVQDILSDNTARALTFGLSSVLQTPFWSAVKTGTSKDMRDNWTIGFSADYTVGVWVGNTDGSAMRGAISGVSGAAPIWQELMQFLTAASASLKPPLPDGVVCTRVTFIDHKESARQECFVAGTERERVQLVSAGLNKGRITHPIDRAIYAIDPDIPLNQQRIALNSDLAATQAVAWRINGRTVTKQSTYAWALEPGQHRIELLRSDSNRVLDTVTIQVK